MKDYYAILGVSPGETSAGIRAAYRDAVRRTHPDHAGAQAAGDFRDVVEAHSVLSDPDRRQQYNDTRNRQEQQRPAPEVRNSPSNTRQHSTLPGLSFELILTPQEAAVLEVVSIGIPVEEVCWACNGSGRDWLFPCLRCGGQGRVSRLQPVEFRIPQPLRAGLMREVPLQTLRWGNLLLNFRIRVSGQHR